jgi:hypothetical protein
MKMRSGFVSNSSTSSFFMLFRNATKEELGDSHVVLSMEGGEGMVMFHPTPEIVEWLKANEPDEPYDLYYSYFDVRDGEDTINRAELVAKIAAIPEGDVRYLVQDVEQWYPESLEDFLEGFNIEEEEDEDA